MSVNSNELVILPAYNFKFSDFSGIEVSEIKEEEIDLELAAAKDSGDCIEPEKDSGEKVPESLALVDEAPESFSAKDSGAEPGYFLAHRVVTKKCYDNLKNKYPHIFAKASHTRMFEYLALGTFADRETKRLILTQKLTAQIEGEQDALINNRYSAIRFLQEYKSVMPAFQWSEYYENTPRMVISSGLDDQDRAWIQESFVEKRIKGTEKVLMRSGESFTQKKMYEARRATDARFAEKVGTMNVHPEQKKVIDYLESLDEQVFTRLFNKNMEDTIKLKDSLYYDPTKPNSKPTQERILDYISEYPKPHYHADMDSNTMRISPSGENFLGLKRELRKSLAKGCWSADLRSSQFAILATQLDSKEAKKFIQSGKKLWSELSLFIKGDPVCSEEDKAAMKQTIYAMAFGKSISGTYDRNGTWHDGLKQILAPRNLEKMLEHDVIKDMLERRKAWFKAIKKKGGWFNAFGIFQKLTPGRPERAIAASVVQSVEFKIINGVFDVAQEQGEKLEFRIISFQHDGFLMVMNDKRNETRIQRVLAEEVQKRADKMNVTTCLEFEKY